MTSKKRAPKHPGPGRLVVWILRSLASVTADFILHEGPSAAVHPRSEQRGSVPGIARIVAHEATAEAVVERIRHHAGELLVDREGGPTVGRDAGIRVVVDVRRVIATVQPGDAHRAARADVQPWEELIMNRRGRSHCYSCAPRSPTIRGMRNVHFHLRSRPVVVHDIQMSGIGTGAVVDCDDWNIGNAFKRV